MNPHLVHINTMAYKIDCLQKSLTIPYNFTLVMQVDL